MNTESVFPEYLEYENQSLFLPIYDDRCSFIVKGKGMRWTFESGWSVVATWSKLCLAKVDGDRVLSFQVIVMYENEPIKVNASSRDYILAYVKPEKLAKIVNATAFAFPGQLGEFFIQEDLEEINK